MKQNNNTLKVKDLIITGAFAALYIVLLLTAVSFMGFIPVTYLLVPLLVPIILGPVFMMYTMKIPKFGAIIILSAIVGLVTSMGGVWYALIWSLFIGVVAELIAKSGQYKSQKLYVGSFSVFANTIVGPFLMILFAKPAFLQSCTEYYGKAYADKLDALTPSWIFIVLIGMALIGGFIGANFGKKILRKHFEKAGIR